MEAFEAFDFSRNAGWLRHLSTVEVPGEVDGGGGESRAMRLVKAKWYKREIEPNFDVDLVRKASSGPKSATSNPPRPSNSSTNAQHTSGGGPRSQEQAPPPRQPQARTGPGSQWAEKILFYMRVALVLLAAASFFPFIPAGRSCFIWALQMAVGVHGQKLYMTYGLPQLRPFPAALASWFQQLRGHTDFHYLCYALLFTTGSPVFGVLPPLVILAVYHIFAYATVNFGSNPLWQRYGVRGYQWLQEKQQQALLFNAVSEVSLGFLTLLGLLSPARSFVKVYFVWTILKLRYRAADSSFYHEQLWRQINEKTRPYYSRVPYVPMVIEWIRQWFNN
mmetsp:Transcript_244/g.763  ORF Transcript_244/g.763 Transcript_244/m.763 type:complete len:334 (-) Transcript_244:128-1129(-)